MWRIKGRRWPVVVIVCGAITAGLLLLAQDQETLRVRSPLAAGDARHPSYLAALIGAPVNADNAFEVLQNGDAAFSRMLSDIRSATQRISFESFIYGDGEVSALFTEALANAARRGVDVRIVLDAFGSSDLPATSLEALTDAGVQVVWFNPLRAWTLEETNYRTHRKVLVVDGHVGYTGGMGIADHWRGDARTPEEWRDTQFRATGPIVRMLEASFYENWLESGGQEAPVLDLGRAPEPGTTTAVAAWSNATGGASNVKLLYLLAIAAARERLDLQSPYFMLDESTRWALHEARGRGVVVRVLTEGERTDAMPVKFASHNGYDALLVAGLEIYEYQPTMMHVKAMMVDGVLSVFGSANFDNRSFELNDELTVVAWDRALAARLTEAFERDLKRSRHWTLDTWRSRGLLARVRERFWGAFGELF